MSDAYCSVSSLFAGLVRRGRPLSACSWPGVPGSAVGRPLRWPLRWLSGSLDVWLAVCSSIQGAGFFSGVTKGAADDSGVSQKCTGTVSNYEDLAETGFQPHNATLRPPGRLRDVAGCVRNGQRN